MTFPVELLVVDDLALSADASRNAWDDTALTGFLAGIIGVVARVSERPSGTGHSVEE